MRETRLSGGVGGVAGNARHPDPIAFTDPSLRLPFCARGRYRANLQTHLETNSVTFSCNMFQTQCDNRWGNESRQATLVARRGFVFESAARDAFIQRSVGTIS